MSNQTAILSNHSLNTSSIEVVAQQLSGKLQATVVYGYCTNLEVAPLHWKGDYDYIELGKVDFNDNSQKQFFLCDMYYLHRELLEKHKEFITNEILPYLRDLEDVINSKNKLYYEFFEKGDGIKLDIFQNAIDIHFLESYDWRSFTRLFSYASLKESINYLQVWRKEHQTLIHLFGGNEMIVYEDIAEDFENLAEIKTTTFEQLKQKAISEHPNSYCSISHFLQEKKYIGLPKYDDAPLTKEDINKLQNGLPLELKNKEKGYELFFDDFRDLKIDN
ncbi:hypothetical protein [Flavobacterium sp.]|uniref:hypothetical protein n=1 Tax=Flavobacterium sp. TaxID=239 RepID=UPI0035293457